VSAFSPDHPGWCRSLDAGWERLPRPVRCDRSAGWSPPGAGRGACRSVMRTPRGGVLPGL